MILGSTVNIWELLEIKSTNVTLSGSSVDILTPSFFLGSDDSYISGSTTGVAISSSVWKN